MENPKKKSSKAQKSVETKPKKRTSAAKPKVAEKRSTAMSKPELTDIDNLITQAFARHRTEFLINENKQKFKEMTHLSTIAEEYLSCFSIIGYSLQGEKVCIFSATTSKDEAALVDLLRATFLEIANNRP